MGVYRKNDTWWIDYYYQERRYRQKIGNRKKDAEEALSKIKVKIASGDFVTVLSRLYVPMQLGDSGLATAVGTASKRRPSDST